MEESAEDGAAMVNGVNGVDHDAEMANGEAGGQSDSRGVGAGLQGERQPNKVRITTPYLTKYERARILGTRALQIRCTEVYVIHVPFKIDMLVAER
jgi:DNA-directed RNA polymerase I, II, and III subunit RPABC2